MGFEFVLSRDFTLWMMVERDGAAQSRVRIRLARFRFLFFNKCSKSKSTSSTSQFPRGERVCVWWWNFLAAHSICMALEDEDLGFGGNNFRSY